MALDAQVTQVQQAEFRLNQARRREQDAVARRVRAESDLAAAQERATKWLK